MRKIINHNAQWILKGLGIIILTLTSIQISYLMEKRGLWRVNSMIQPNQTDGLSQKQTHQNILEVYGRMPLTFVPNSGQRDSRIHYYFEGSRYGFYFAKDEVVLTFFEKSNDSNPSETFKENPLRDKSLQEDKLTTKGISLALRFIGSNPDVQIEGRKEENGKVNYFIGNDPKHWRTGFFTYREIVYRDVWSGVDAIFHGEDGQLKYEFVVYPGAFIEDIRLEYLGAEGLSLDDEGNLKIKTSLGVITDVRPKSYQDSGKVRLPVESHFAIEYEGENGKLYYTFDVGDSYDSTIPLIIDPGLIYSTFLGGSLDDVGTGALQKVAVDASGNAYVVGASFSSNFPITPGAFDTSLSGVTDVCVTKFNAMGSALIFSTFIGGSGSDNGRGLAINSLGEVFIAGNTISIDFPRTPNAYDTTHNGAQDQFIVKLNASGSTLLFGTFIGGSAGEPLVDLAIDASGNSYITGHTTSSNYPRTSSAFDTSFSGPRDAVLAVLNSTGTSLLYGTFLGGTGPIEGDQGDGIYVDPSGYVYVTGATSSNDFPTTSGSFDPTYNGNQDAFLVKLNPAGNGSADLIIGTFLGDSSANARNERGVDIAVDSIGNIHIVGHTRSPNFPTTSNAYDATHNGDYDVFALKLNSSGNTLLYSTYLGGNEIDFADGMALDASGKIYITGSTSSNNFPTTQRAFDTSFNGVERDAFVAKIDPSGTGSSSLHYSTFLGGSQDVINESGSNIAVDVLEEVYIIGFTEANNFPTTPQAWDNSFNGLSDVFLTKLVMIPDPDSDGIADTVDTDRNNSSNDFSDIPLGGGTSGTISNRGDQILTITEEPNPGGVRIKASLSGGASSATITACSGDTIRSLNVGDNIVLTCGSTTIKVERGEVDIQFIAIDGSSALVNLSAGNSLVFDPTTFTMMAPISNTIFVVVRIDGEEFILTPGEIIQKVAIDIKPGSNPNSINCLNLNEVITVAILKTESFDAVNIDHTSVLFGPEDAQEIHTSDNGVKRHEEDVDFDEDTDLVIHFLLKDTGLNCEDILASLKGKTFEGMQVGGVDAIRMIGESRGPQSVEEGSILPTRFFLHQSSPNPFNQSTVIRYGLQGSTQTTLRVYDLSGRVVRTLMNGDQKSGYYSVLWDGRDNHGKRVASGVYFYRLVAGNFNQTRKMTVLR